MRLSPQRTFSSARSHATTQNSYKAMNGYIRRPGQTKRWSNKYNRLLVAFWQMQSVVRHKQVRCRQVALRCQRITSFTQETVQQPNAAKHVAKPRHQRTGIRSGTAMSRAALASSRYEEGGEAIEWRQAGWKNCCPQRGGELVVQCICGCARQRGGAPRAARSAYECVQAETPARAAPVCGRCVRVV